MYVFISCDEDGSFEFLCSAGSMTRDMICAVFEDAIEAIYGSEDYEDEEVEELDFNNE